MMKSHLIYTSDLTLYRIIHGAGPAGTLMTRHVHTDQVHIFGQKLQNQKNRHVIVNMQIIVITYNLNV